MKKQMPLSFSIQIHITMKQFKNLLRLLAFTLVFMAITNGTYAQDDIKLSLQGTLKDANGAAVEDGPQDLTFRLYHESSGGTAFWEEAAEVNVIGGVYSHNLGETTPLNAANFSTTVYVGVTVQGVELSPRAQLTYAPYTLYVGFAGNGTPVGGIVPYAGLANNVPEGWLVCNGQALDADDLKYANLYAALGTSWGDGSNGTGSTFDSDFNVPDLRGLFLRGQDDGAGRDSDAGSRTALMAGGATGDKVGTYQVDENKAHSHTMQSAGDHTHTMPSSGAHSHTMTSVVSMTGESTYGNGGDGEANAINTTNTGGNHTHPINSAGDHEHTINNSGGSESRPKNATVVYIIKY